MSRTFVTTSRSAMTQFGPTSCSAKRSDLFLPKVRYVRASICNKRAATKTKVRLEKKAGPFEGECVRVHTLVRSPAFPGETNALAFALHLYRFSHGQSFFFSKKIYGSRMGSKIGSRFGVQKGGPRFVNTHLMLRNKILVAGWTFYIF